MDDAEQPITRFQAQRKLGLFAPHDYVMCSLITVAWVTMIFWAIFGSPGSIQLLAVAVMTMFFTQCWIIVLLYRILVFLLDMHADITLLPRSAAQMVLEHWKTGD